MRLRNAEPRGSLEILDEPGDRLHHVEANAVAPAGGTEVRAALERPRNGRYGEPGDARRVVVPLRLGGFVGHFGVLVPLALLGVVRHLAERRRLWMLYAMLATYAATLVIFYVFARYRCPSYRC